VGADAVLAAVVDGPEVEHLLHVPPAALDLPELLVAEGDVLGGERGVRGAQEQLAVEPLLGPHGRLVDAQEAAGRGAQVALQAGLRPDRPAQLGALLRRELVGAGDHVGEAGDEAPADGGVTFGALGVVADDEALACGHTHLLDAQAAGELGVAAGAREGGLGLRGPSAQLLGHDVVLVAASQGAAVLLAREAAVGHPNHA